MEDTTKKHIEKQNKILDKLRLEISQTTKTAIEKRNSLRSCQENKQKLETELEVAINEIGSYNRDIQDANIIQNKNTRIVADIERELEELDREEKISCRVDEMPDFYSALLERMHVVQAEYDGFDLELKSPKEFVTSVKGEIEGRNFNNYTVLLRDASFRYKEAINNISVKKVDGIKLYPKDYTSIKTLLDGLLRNDMVSDRWS